IVFRVPLRLRVHHGLGGRVVVQRRRWVLSRVVVGLSAGRRGPGSERPCVHLRFGRVGGWREHGANRGVFPGNRLKAYNGQRGRWMRMSSHRARGLGHMLDAQVRNVRV
ncbi:MAG: hypothetical protein ACK55I_06725, partial [bacterium]